MTALLRPAPADRQRLPGALGKIEGVVIAEVWGAVDGWIVHPEHPLDRVRMMLNGALMGEADLDERADVAEFFPPVPHARICHFLAQGPVRNLQGKPLYLEAIGLSGGREVVQTEDYWPGDDTLAIPAPAEGLRKRVAGIGDETSFRRSGYGIAGQLLAAVREFLPGMERPRVLDWGCGSGRATRYMRVFWPGLPLTGCDIDVQAIEWCRQNIGDVRFDVTGPFPPLPYPDGAFDAVIGSSVMTHLAGPVQMQWLHEIRRVLAPGGVFVTSVLGSLASVGLPEQFRAVLARDGMMDQKHDEALDGVAPAGYYRSTYQSEAYTRRQWRRVLPVLDYRVGGLNNFQDLVVMRRESVVQSLWRDAVGG
jgi:SAM-dependent methyltransferase